MVDNPQAFVNMAAAVIFLLIFIAVGCAFLGHYLACKLDDYLHKELKGRTYTKVDGGWKCCACGWWMANAGEPCECDEHGDCVFE